MSATAEPSNALRRSSERHHPQRRPATFAIYVASYKDFTLGAFDTVLRRRVTQWFQLAADGVNTCDNDPMCGQTSSHKPHAACDRCLHTSFGCKTWNADLDRKLLRRFWAWTLHQAGAP